MNVNVWCGVGNSDICYRKYDFKGIENIFKIFTTKIRINF